MTIFSLSQAAKKVGVGKGTISKALSNGRLSYVEKTSAGYKIEASELFRVFPKPGQVRSREQMETPKNTNSETALLREMLEREREFNKELNQRLAQSENERKELESERRDLSLRLEHQNQRKKFLGIF